MKTLIKSISRCDGSGVALKLTGKASLNGGIESTEWFVSWGKIGKALFRDQYDDSDAIDRAREHGVSMGEAAIDPIDKDVSELQRSLDLIYELQNRLNTINRLLYAQGAPLGSEEYFQIRELVGGIVTSAPSVEVNMSNCKAVQYSDQMVCEDCKLAWGVNDGSPPSYCECGASCRHPGFVRHRLALANDSWKCTQCRAVFSEAELSILLETRAVDRKLDRVLAMQGVPQ